MDIKGSCLLVASNPNPNSLTIHAATHSYHALLAQGTTTELIHLDTVSFNPILSLEEISRRASFDEQTLRYQALIHTQKVLGLFFPDWWGFPPALLVGWIQKVFMPGVAFVYTGNEFMPKNKEGLLTHLKVCIIISSDEKNENMIETSIDSLAHRLFYPSGITQVKHSILSDTRNASIHTKNKWVARNSELLCELCKT